MNAGKGDWRRPYDPEQYAENYNRIFSGEAGEDFANEVRGATCRDPSPRPPYTGRCILAAGHDGYHTDGETEWADPNLEETNGS